MAGLGGGEGREEMRSDEAGRQAYDNCDGLEWSGVGSGKRMLRYRGNEGSVPRH